MNSQKKNRDRAASALATLVISTIPLFGLVFALEIGAWYFDSKSTALDGDGIVTTATIYDVTKDRLGEALNTLSEHKRNVSSGNRTKLQNWKRHYHFFTEDGVEVKGSQSGQFYEKPPIGQTLEIRYSPSDPTVFETAIGHTESQGAALHWIALVFGLVWVGMFIWAIPQLLFQRWRTMRSRRLERTDLVSAKRVEESQ